MENSIEHKSIGKRIVEKILTLVFKVRNGVCPSYLTDILHTYVPTRQTLQSSDTPTLTVPNFKLKTVGDRSFWSVRPRLWNSRPHSRRAGLLACSDAIPGTVTALLRRLHLMAAHFGGLSPGQNLLLPPPFERVIVRERANCPHGSGHAVKTLHVELRWAPALCNQRTEKNVC